MIHKNVLVVCHSVRIDWWCSVWPLGTCPSHVIVQVDDETLQDNLLVVKVWDHDTIGTDDIIGQVVVDLSPLLNMESVPGVGDGHLTCIDNYCQLFGWFPIFDTLQGL